MMIITDKKEIELLEQLLKEKRWNPFCIRHSAITDDNANSIGDIAPKVGWSINTKQRGRYAKSKIGKDMRRHILERDGIILDEEKVKPTSKICYRYNYINGFDYQVCHKCGYPLSQEALNRIKEKQDEKMNKFMLEVLKSRFEIWLRNYKDKLINENYLEVDSVVKKDKNQVVVRSTMPISVKDQVTKFKEYYSEDVSD